MLTLGSAHHDYGLEAAQHLPWLCYSRLVRIGHWRLVGRFGQPEGNGSSEFAVTSTPVTAALLYDLVACPHRVTMDLTGDPAKRDKPNAFVELLWERGSLYEKEVIAGLTEPVVDLSGYSAAEKEQRTLDAMERGEPLIYSGRIQAGDLLGEPDLIRRDDAGYCAGDIKSGSGEEGPENDSKPKIHYAVQLGLYTDILERMGLSSGRRTAFGSPNSGVPSFARSAPVSTPISVAAGHSSRWQCSRMLTEAARATRSLRLN